MSTREIAATMIILVAFVCPTSAAQPTWELGVIGGTNVARLTGDTEEMVTGEVPGEGMMSGDVDETRLGGLAGGFVMAQITPTFGIRAEALYSQKGGEGDIVGTVFIPDAGDVDFTGTFTFRNSYLEIPVLAALSVPTSRAVTFRGLAGVSIGLALDRKFELELTALNQTESESFDADDLIKGSDFGGVLGAEMAVGLGRSSLLIDARWTLGFSNVADDPSGEVDIKNNAFNLMTGLSFPLGTQ